MVERLKARGRACAIRPHARTVLFDAFQGVVSVEGRNQRLFLFAPLKLCLLGGDVSDQVEISSDWLRKLLLMRQFMPWR